MRRSLLFATGLAGAAAVQAQPTTPPAPADTMRTYEAAPVVVTAARQAVRLSEVAVPVSVVTGAQIAAQRPMRLADLLADQPGLAIVDTRGGPGLQIQGFSPEYTLILIDGEPVIGRLSGTLDLERISVASVERVEIVRGPTSSRYGSDALAGVVNVITRRPEGGWRGEVSARAETNATHDLSVQGEGGSERLGLRLLLNRYGSGGYDLTPGTPGQNGPRFGDVSGEARLSAMPSDALDLDVTARLASQHQSNEIDLDGGLYTDEQSRREASLTPRLRWRLRPALRLDASVHAAAYATNERLALAATDSATDDTDFDQTYGKAEATLTWVPTARLALYAGSGAIHEGIGGDRYADAKTAWQGFAFAEATWQAHPRLDVNASARFDRHRDYAPSLTPKLALLARPARWARLRASVGSGFKAPAFRQLYLDFTNTAAGGYSVYGATDVRERLAALDAAGGISEILVPLETLGDISAERSVSLSIGGEATRGAWTLRADAFRNDVRDLIETEQVAIKTNGQPVFSYANLARVTTQGVETELTWRPRRGLRLGASHQFLDTADRDVLDQIDAGTLYRITAGGSERRVTRADYGGLLGRSRHSGTVRAEATGGRGETASVRLTWRGRYGDRAGLNGNLILDDPREYVAGYPLVNVTLTHPLGALLGRAGVAAATALDRVTLSAGARNLFDHTDAERLPSLPGRLLFGGLSVRL